MAERLADNAHQLWAKQKMAELDSLGKLPSIATLFSFPLFSPYSNISNITLIQLALP
ncbi:unnamed protein product [Protopolystoma xenopodis]|uniref:Uncharacterized protein n=1 Tax=Protopolystoma xenopodis TaxID=117903 RepID=A0A3S5AUX7_9PLAT|nr:unnamed protein product [Protopolystoma xenopodis]